MTRRDQTIRAWIKRPAPGRHWHSHVSIRGKHHAITTNTHIRKAALQFNLLHAAQIITESHPKITPHVQTELF